MITLRTLRERTGMSQKELADVVGVSQQLISQVERGEHALDVGHLACHQDGECLLNYSRQRCERKRASPSGRYNGQGDQGSVRLGTG